ncbi:MAG: hypothetical protein ACR2LM_12315 [Pyrinomonadaceae bacterium]
MNTKLKPFHFVLLILTLVFFSVATKVRASQDTSQPPKSLASEILVLSQNMEVGLEIEARSPNTSWARKGAEAVAVLISVDGKYNQDLLLWAGDEWFRYRVMLGRILKGKHTVSVTLNTPRSAAAARSAEVKSLRSLLFTASPDAANASEEQLAVAYSPFLYARANTIDRFTDIPLLTYYEVLREANNDLVVRYTTVFTNEDGGTQTAALMARWGRATDIEWVYQIRLHGGKIIEETYQGVEHETKFFTGPRTAGNHPLLAVASENNNFSDLACSAVRFAPFPFRARLETATRESVMDLYPQTYRVMAEELIREKRISDAPADINTIADPREYLYIEATSEQEGAALAFDVKVNGQFKSFASDMGEPRLRIDRSGYFRTAVRLPRDISPADVETITARCHANQKPASERRCNRVNVVRALMLDQGYVPRVLPLQTQPESSLGPDEIRVYRVGSQQ